MAPKKLFLLDAYALIYRAHFAFTKNPRISSKGMNTSVPFGFTNTLLEVLQKQKPTHIGVAFDTPAKTFRDDLYFRISAITLTIPPLRDRSEDIPLVARHFAETMQPIGTRPVPVLTDDAAAFLSLQAWPGNVRELRNAVHRAANPAGVRPCESSGASVRGQHPDYSRAVRYRNPP